MVKKIYIVFNGKKIKTYSISKFVAKVNGNLFNTRCFTTKGKANKHIKEMNK